MKLSRIFRFLRLKYVESSILVSLLVLKISHIIFCLQIKEKTLFYKISFFSQESFEECSEYHHDFFQGLFMIISRKGHILIDVALIF